MFETLPSVYTDVGALAPRMLFDGGDHNPRIRLFNPSQKELEVGIHRHLGDLAGIEDI